ncbi:MAG: YncE family protein [Gemmatimonadetes bacterium]|nr:YncE family protein [Gemmatimonadota bacterium]
MRRRAPQVALLSVALAASACSVDRPIGHADAGLGVLTDSTSTDSATANAMRRAFLAATPTRGARRPLDFSRASGNPTPLQLITSLPVIQPWALAMNTSGIALVSSLGLNNVTFIDVPSARILGTAPTGGLPTDIALTADGNTAYVANQDGTLTVLDVNTRQVLRTLTIPSTAVLCVAVSATTGAVYAGDGNGFVSRLDPISGAILAQSSVGSLPNGLVVNPAGSRVYVTNTHGGQFVELDATTLAPTRPTIFIGGVVQDIAISPAGDRAVVANETGFLSDVNLLTGGVVNIPTAGGAFGLVTSPAAFSLIGVTGPNLGYQVYQVSLGQLRPPFAQIRGGLRRGGYHPATRWIAVTNTWNSTVDLFR